MAGREGVDDIALFVDGFQLGREEDVFGRLGVVALVEGRDADRVAGGDHAGGGDGFVEEDKGEHAVEHVAEVGVVFSVLGASNERSE